MLPFWRTAIFRIKSGILESRQESKIPNHVVNNLKWRTPGQSFSHKSIYTAAKFVVGIYQMVKVEWLLIPGQSFKARG